jgi:hypothetical protein
MSGLGLIGSPVQVCTAYRLPPEFGLHNIAGVAATKH